MNLPETLRKLWADHVIWSRSCLVAVIADLPDVSAARERLLKNQDEMGEALGTVYGEQVAHDLAVLLREHIMLATKLVAAAKNNDVALFQEIHKQWYTNADETALFLHKVNPNWSLEEMRKLMYDHLELTNQDVQMRLQKDWAGDVEAFDKVFDQALHIADCWSAGIEQQQSNDNPKE